MAVLWLSGSAEPGASVNVAPAEEKSLVSWCCEQHGGRGGEGRGPELVGRGEREVGAKGAGLEGSSGS